MDFFFYGTLLDPDIRRLVLQCDVPRKNIVAATLAGFRRYAVPDAPYPAAVRHAGGEIEGIVVRGLDVLDAARLSNFEGEKYPAALCPVTLVQGRAEEAWVFIANDQVPLGEKEWSLETWQRADKDQFLEFAHSWLGERGDDKVAVQERLWRTRLETG